MRSSILLGLMEESTVYNTLLYILSSPVAALLAFVTSSIARWLLSRRGRRITARFETLLSPAQLILRALSIHCMVLVILAMRSFELHALEGWKLKADCVPISLQICTSLLGLSICAVLCIISVWIWSVTSSEADVKGLMPGESPSDPQQHTDIGQKV